jgi:hypothetical protein
MTLLRPSFPRLRRDEEEWSSFTSVCPHRLQQQDGQDIVGLSILIDQHLGQSKHFLGPLTWNRCVNGNIEVKAELK